MTMVYVVKKQIQASPTYPRLAVFVSFSKESRSGSDYMLSKSILSATSAINSPLVGFSLDE